DPPVVAPAAASLAAGVEDRAARRASVVWAVAGGLLALASCVAPAGPGEAAAAMLALGTLGVMVGGLRHNQPAPAWPWRLLVVTGVLFMVGGALRTALAT